MKRLFIINPSSGNGNISKIVENLKHDFEFHTGEFPYIIPDNRQNTIDATRKALKDGFEQIIAVGGDGTINTIVNGFYEKGNLINTKSCLAIIRAGTGKDYIKSIMDESVDPTDVILNPRIKQVDVGEIVYKNNKFKPHYFINMASLGMIADIVEKKNTLPAWIPAKFKYFLPSFYSMLTFKPQKVILDWGAGRWVGKALTLSISKGLYAGGGMRFGEEITLFDARFELTIFEKMNPVSMMLKFKKIYGASLKNEKLIHKFHVSNLKISCPDTFRVEFDGELYGASDCEIKIRSRELAVCFPKNY